VLSQLYSAFSGVSGKELTNDPLMLVRGSQLALQQTASQMRLMNGWLVAIAIPRYWRIVELIPHNSQGKRSWVQLQELFDETR